GADGAEVRHAIDVCVEKIGEHDRAAASQERVARNGQPQFKGVRAAREEIELRHVGVVADLEELADKTGANVEQAAVEGEDVLPERNANRQDEALRADGAAVEGY